MPIYEYRCDGCGRKVEILHLRTPEAQEAACPGCGGSALKRLVSRFATPKSEEARLEALTDPSRLAGLDENDPASMARWMKRMGKELGEDIGGEEIDQMAEEIASGNTAEAGLGAGGSPGISEDSDAGGL